MAQNTVDLVGNIESGSQLGFVLNTLSSSLNKEFPSHTDPAAFHCSKPHKWRERVDTLRQEINQDPDRLILLSFKLEGHAFEYMFALQKSYPELSINQLSEEAAELFWEAAITQPAIAFAWGCSEEEINQAITKNGVNLAEYASQAKIAYETGEVKKQIGNGRRFPHPNRTLIRRHYAYLRLQGRDTERSEVARAANDILCEPKELSLLTEADFLMMAESVDDCEVPWMNFIKLLNGASRLVIQRFLPIVTSRNDSPFGHFADQNTLEDLLYMGGFPPHYAAESRARAKAKTQADAEAYAEKISTLSAEQYGKVVQQLSAKSPKIFWASLSDFADFLLKLSNEGEQVDFHRSANFHASLSLDTFFVRSRRAPDEIFKRIFDVFGLEGCTHFTWSEANTQVFDSFRKLFDLSNHDPNLARHLNKRYGIAVFSRYAVHKLVEQLELEKNPPEVYSLFLIDQSDQNINGGSSYHNLTSLSGKAEVVCEFGRDFTAAARMLIELSERFGAPRCTFLYSHGTPNSSAGLKTTDVQRSRGVQALIAELLPKDSHLVLCSCSTGQDEGAIASSVSAVADGIVHAPVYATWPDPHFNWRNDQYNFAATNLKFQPLPVNTFISGKVVATGNEVSIPMNETPE